MTVEQLFRAPPATDAIVVRERADATRILAGAETARVGGAPRGGGSGARRLLRALIASRRGGAGK
jgi:hypothetical protein